MKKKQIFCSWDEGSKEISYPPIGLHSQLIGASVTSLCVHNENAHEILDISLKTLDSQELHLWFYDSWALYTESELLVAGQMDEYVDRFAQIAHGGVLERFTSTNDLGFYGCSLNFSSMMLRQVGSSEPVWAWRILDDKGNLLWRAPVDAEVNRGLIGGVENPVL